jgi:hypothetical protein
MYKANKAQQHYLGTAEKRLLSFTVSQYSTAQRATTDSCTLEAVFKEKPRAPHRDQTPVI